MTREAPTLAGGSMFPVAAAATYDALPFTFGEHKAFVHVRWTATVDSPARKRLERVDGIGGRAVVVGRFKDLRPSAAPAKGQP